MTSTTSPPERAPGSARTGRAPLTLRRGRDGRLYDPRRRRPVDLDELCDQVRAGLRFRAYHWATGRDCTAQVLLDLVTFALGQARPVLPPQPGLDSSRR